MASTVPRHLQLMLLLLLVIVAAAMRAAAACAGEVFPAGRTYATCQDLPHLGAALHWTYAASSSLSLAFVAAPAAPGGWVAWGINPTGQGMVGTQALMALAGGASSSSVRTYNITGTVPVGAVSTPIAFRPAGLAADVGGGGKIRLYATLQLDRGMEVVNQVWQVGSSVTGGAPDMHALAPENLSSMGKLNLTAGVATSSPSPAPGGAPSSGDDGPPFVPPSTTPFSWAAATATVSAPSLVVLALLGFLYTIPF